MCNNSEIIIIIYGHRHHSFAHTVHTEPSLGLPEPRANQTLTSLFSLRKTHFHNGKKNIILSIYLQY